ncbi:UEV-domain-containing protein [Lindgomyces ingoldianus]|uniref:UEV-domain-containing protein n=1 Tax=Lindgomyces ingoldianus TaxID=673940 RepID=A0ACB6QTN6_9PLEO|nr:UEV-domain-containing protein [Lindgomyces ingoldianus]KAF2470231.1 UEV-domain-containing protein [Lindgomyces ingoldianus]
MAGVTEKVLNWLYSVLPSEYSDVNRTYNDVADTLSNYPSLSPRTEVYTYENGASALLLLLSGTLPVTFRGATYGFPVAIWVPHAYPRESPIVYVKPSQDMLVRPGQHVSGDGRIYHPYLAQWGKYWDKSTIFDFLAVLRGVFAKEPPVRSKQQYGAPTPQAPPPVPPPPAEWRRSMQGTPAASPSPDPSSSQSPVPPPKPPKPYEQNRPTPPPQQDRHSGYVPPPPPVPPHPPRQYQQQHQHPTRNGYPPQSHWPQQNVPPQNFPPRQSSYDTNPPTPISKPMRPHVQAQGGEKYPPSPHEIRSPVSPISPEDQRPAPRYSKPMPPTSGLTNFSRPQHYQAPLQHRHHGPPLPAQQTYQQGPPHSYLPQPYQQYQQPPPQVQPAHSAPAPPTNLLDESLEVTIPSQTGNQVPLPVPPVPPNPEKDALLRALSTTLVSQIRQIVSANHSAITPLHAQQTALQAAYSRLQSEFDQLQQLDEALASNEKILRDAMLEADRVMEEARTRKVPDVDEVLVAPMVVGGQLYSLAAEERGIAECLFVLGRALDKGRIGADVFVKQTRSLAREQFLKKALIKKIARGMALDEYQMQ